MAMNRRPKAKRSNGGASATASEAGGSNKRARSKTLDLSKRPDDEHIDSSDEEYDGPNGTNRSNDDSSEEENLDVKKVRLAREYLAGIDTAPDSDHSAADHSDDDAYDAVSRRLQRERLVRRGALKRDCAEEVTTSLQRMQEQCRLLSLSRCATSTTAHSSVSSVTDWIQAGHVTLLKHHDLTPTCVALTGDARFAVSGSKDHSVVVWDLERQTPMSTLCPHWKKATKQKAQNHRTMGQVLSVACSDDGKFVAVGKRDATVAIYDVRAPTATVVATAATAAAAAAAAATPLQTFTGHKGAVTALAFRSQSHQLFTASDDRCIRHYNLDEMLYMETLYGHQFGITDIDCYINEQPVSVGRDRTARAWKLSADSHLIFRGGAKVPSADTVTCIQEDWFLTGHDNGVVSLWNTDKKRAVASVEQAHGPTAHAERVAAADAAAQASAPGRGVVSIASIKGSDVAATGSNDGFLRFWKVRTERNDRGLDRMGEIPLPGFINDVCFSHTNASKLFCVAAIGQEHRLGRWERVARAKNRLAIVQLQPETTEVEEDED